VTRHRFTGCTLLLLLLATPLAAQFAGPSVAARELSRAIAAPPSGLEAFLASYVPALLEEFPTPGVAIALVDSSGALRTVNFGFADVATSRPMTDTTLFIVASVSKMFTAIGVMRLVEEGRVDLSAPVSRYLVRWSLPESPFDHTGVTVERVLSHNAGLGAGGGPEYTPDEDLPTLVDALGGENKLDEPVHVVAEPGSAPKYSNAGYALLQLLIEDVTGEAFEPYMQRSVLDPLGMRRSAFGDPVRPEIASRLATPYDWLMRPVPPGRVSAVAMGGLNTTAPDLARLVTVELTAGGGGEETPVLRGDTFRRMQRPAPGAGPFGLGHIVQEAGGVTVVGHTGLMVGWNAALELAPERGKGIVVLTNGDNGYYVHQAIVAAWAQFELGAAVASGVVPARKRINRLLGVFAQRMELGTMPDSLFQGIVEPLERAEQAVGREPIEEVERLLQEAEQHVPESLSREVTGHFAGIRDWLVTLADGAGRVR